MPAIDLTIDEVLSTTRSVRQRLDLQRPVEREVLLECLALATQAPSGANVQNWQWLFVTDSARKGALAELYRRAQPIFYPARDETGLNDQVRRGLASARY